MEIPFWLPKGSILGQLLFNIFFLADLFLSLVIKIFASYEECNTEYIVADKADDLFKSLKETSIALLQWSDNNLFLEKM